MSVVSVIIPAFRAEATVLRAVQSLQAQTHAAWQAILVSDDGTDYATFLAGCGFSDPRVVFTSTGRIGSGCHRARNAGLARVEGDLVTGLDADDFYAPERLARLVPLAERFGASADRMLCVDADSLAPLSDPHPETDHVIPLDLSGFMQLDQPLMPVIRRALVRPRHDGVELAEDVIANACLLDRCPQIGWLQAELYSYCIRRGSLAHSDVSGARFETAYATYLTRLHTGDGFGLSAPARALVTDGLWRKQALNKAFETARRANPALTFQSFVAGV
jgi:succinoglycan biosynthesis protein ExoO